MKKLFFILVGFAMCANAFASDVITLQNGEEIQAKVVEVSADEIKYKKASNPDGPTFVAKKSEIFMLKYENGEKEVYKNTPVAPAAEKASIWSDEKPMGFGLYVDPMGFAFCGMQIGAEFRYKKFLLDAHVRLPKTGAVMRAVCDNPDEMSAFGFGFGPRAFFPNRVGGWYVGCNLEVGNHELAWYDEHPNMEKDKYVGAMVAGGFKFHFKNGLFMNTALQMGTIFISDCQKRDWDNYYGLWENWYVVDKPDPAAYFMGMAVVAIGYEF